MADMFASRVLKSEPIALGSGERLQVLILNADGTIKTNLIDDICPVGKSFTGVVSYDGLI
jgi:hypothetical protein